MVGSRAVRIGLLSLLASACNGDLGTARTERCASEDGAPCDEGKQCFGSACVPRAVATALRAQVEESLPRIANPQRGSIPPADLDQLATVAALADLSEADKRALEVHLTNLLATAAEREIERRRSAGDVEGICRVAAAVLRAGVPVQPEPLVEAVADGCSDGASVSPAFYPDGVVRPAFLLSQRTNYDADPLLAAHERYRLARSDSMLAKEEWFEAFYALLPQNPMPAGAKTRARVRELGCSRGIAVRIEGAPSYQALDLDAPDELDAVLRPLGLFASREDGWEGWAFASMKIELDDTPLDLPYRIGGRGPVQAFENPYGSARLEFFDPSGTSLFTTNASLADDETMPPRVLGPGCDATCTASSMRKHAWSSMMRAVGAALKPELAKLKKPDERPAWYDRCYAP